jgi:alpha-methylacyl-CoA racemase
MAGPLKGLKVLDFTTLLPGPFATLILADLGADVLKINSGSRPDLLTFMQPFLPGSSLSAVHAYLARGKRSMALNLKHPAAIEVIHRLLQNYDILIEQSRPGVMKKFGLDYQSLEKVNPRLIYCSITGYGQNSPLAQRAGHDINYLARSGVMSYSGKSKSGPSLYGMQIADAASGSNNAVIAILAAVISRIASGQGQHLDISMTDGVISFNAIVGASFLVDGKQPRPEGWMLNGGSLYDFYETSDGQYLSVGCVEPKFFDTFCEVIEREDLKPSGINPENLENVKDEIRTIIRSKSRDEWKELFNKKDACVEPVLSISEALENEHAKIRELIVEVEGPGKQKVRQLANPIKFSETKQEYHFTGVPLGTHTQDVMKELGYAPEDISDLKKSNLFSAE